MKKKKKSRKKLKKRKKKNDENEEEEEEEEGIHFEEAKDNLEASTEFLVLKLCWKGLCPPKKEEEIVGKWFACICDSKKRSNLYIGRVCRRFLNGEGGLPTFL